MGTIVDLLFVGLAIIGVGACLLWPRKISRWRGVGVVLSIYWLVAVPIHYLLVGSLGPISVFVLGYLGIPGTLFVSTILPSAEGVLLLGAGSLLSAAGFVAVVWTVETQLLRTTHE